MTESGRLFIDLDGTIVDPKRRMYGLFSDLVPMNSLSFEEYWSLKRTGIRQADLLKKTYAFSPEQISDFRLSWMKKIEEPERLQQDTLIPYAADALLQLHQQCDLILITHRQHPERVKKQLINLNVFSVFKMVLVTRQRQSKSDMILSRISVIGSDVMAGDTGEDIQAGKILGIRTVGVTCGLLNHETLSGYGPDQLLSGIHELVGQ